LPQEQRHASISNIHNEILKCFITNPYKKSSGVTEITPLVDWLDYLPPMMPPMRPIIASMVGLIVSKIVLNSMDYLSFFKLVLGSFLCIIYQRKQKKKRTFFEKTLQN